MPNEPPNFYERLFERAYDIRLDESGDFERGIKDPELARAYQTLIEMRGYLVQCASVFQSTAQEAAAEMENASALSMVERQTLERKVHKYQSMTRLLQDLIDKNPKLSETRWKPISGAPQDGTPIRVIGRRRSGEVYCETTRWRAIAWEIEQTGEHLAPTHYQELEQLPEGYGGSRSQFG
jgi:hypothetical protein